MEASLFLVAQQLSDADFSQLLVSKLSISLAIISMVLFIHAFGQQAQKKGA